MQFFSLLLLTCICAFTSYATDDGLTTDVTWSLLINGERVFIFSGEFHYARMPVPELWLDIFQKYKANGLNAVSIYFFWSYHSASKGIFGFETSGKNVQRVLDYAKEAGLYVIARPGPYCNAETNAGGLALWTTDGSGGDYRTNDETYHQAWLPWIQEIGAIIARNQITEGGPVILYQIENELQETTHSADNALVLYMEQIKQASRDAGIVVPFTSNEKGQRSESWSTDYEDVGGAVNVYGLDSYPGGLSCTNPDSGFKVIRNYYQWFQNYSYTQPELFPEFESGYFQPWGGYFYDQCLAEHDPAFADVYYKNNIGQRTTLQSLYMAWGGTNWGNLAAPVVYTSYDYSAPLRETREVMPKFSQTKLIGLFTRVSQDLLYTEMESNGTGNAVSSTDIWTWVLRNPETGARFYTVQHATSSSRAVTDFSIDLKTSLGNITVPDVQLNGRQSKIIISDYHFANKTLLYSSADILTYGIFQTKTVLVLYLQAGQIGELGFVGNVTSKAYGVITNSTTTSVNSNGTVVYTKLTYTQTAGASILSLSNGVILYLLDIPTAWTFFAPPTVTNPNVPADSQIFVLGPYLVRNATISDNTVVLIGDNANATEIEVYAGSSSIDTISWNSVDLETKSTPYNSLKAHIPGIANLTITLPALTSWKAADSLPEKSPLYDDSTWTICNKTTSLSKTPPLTLPVLFSSDYGYYTGAKIYRGHFTSTTATSAHITAQNGLASGWSAYLNGIFVGGNPGNASLSRTSALLNFTNIPLSNATNVLTIVTDYTGHEETSTAPSGPANPRGLLGATLNDPTNHTFSVWKIRGGGAANIDPTRGPLNEGARQRARKPTRFPVPPGVVVVRGVNTLAISGWALTDEGARLDGVEVFAYGVYGSGFGFGDWSYLRPGWSEERLGFT
ncbi:glycoside hydrolase superfamily [Delphinella strobiligena]|nr:glycoside hydrolase superfamily [Delphinella strobiligena]